MTEPYRLLRARRNWPRRRAANERYELSPFQLVELLPGGHNYEMTDAGFAQCAGRGGEGKGRLPFAQDTWADTTTYVNSPGGHVESGDSIHDIIKFVRSSSPNFLILRPDGPGELRLLTKPSLGSVRVTLGGTAWYTCGKMPSPDVSRCLPSPNVSRLLSPAFAKRQRLLSRDQYEIVNVHTSRGLRRAMLFPKAILQAEFEVEPPSVMDRAPKKTGAAHGRPICPSMMVYLSSAPPFSGWAGRPNSSESRE
jgi:hypothetical protein